MAIHSKKGLKTFSDASAIRNKIIYYFCNNDKKGYLKNEIAFLLVKKLRINRLSASYQKVYL